MHVKLFPNFTHHHLITHTNWRNISAMLVFLQFTPTSQRANGVNISNLLWISWEATHYLNWTSKHLNKHSISAYCNLRNETKRNQPKRNQTKRNRPKRNQLKRNQIKRKQPKRNQPKRNQIKRNQTKRNQPKRNQTKRNQPKRNQT